MKWLYGAYFTSMFFMLFINRNTQERLENGAVVQKTSKAMCFLSVLPLLFVSACRLKFFDTTDYKHMYMAVGPHIENAFNNTVERVESGYLLFTALLNKISTDPQFLLIVSSTIILLSITSFVYKCSPDVPLSMFLFASHIWMSAMNGLRQYLAAAILWFAYEHWSRHKSLKKDILFGALVVALMSFHQSIIVCLPFFFFSRGRLLNKRVLLTVFVCLLVYFVPPVYNFLFNTVLGSSDYAGYAETTAKMGIERLIVNMIPLVLVLLYKYKNQYTDRDDRMIWIMNCSCLSACCSLLATKMVYFGRICIFLNVFDLITIPYVINQCFRKGMRQIIKAAFILFYLFLFWRQMIAYGGFATNFKLFFEV